MPASRCAPAFGFCAAALCGFALAASGCYTSPPYGYGYQSTPGFYSSPPPGVYSPGPGVMSPGVGQPMLGPPGSLPPGSTIPPGSTFPPGTTIPPGSTFGPGGYPAGSFPPNNQPFQPTPADGGMGNNWRPNTPTATDKFQPLPQPRATTREQPVPTYNDPEPFTEDPTRKPRPSAPSGGRSTTPSRGTSPMNTFPADDEGKSPFSSGQAPTPESATTDTIASARVAPPSGPALIRDDTVMTAAATEVVPTSNSTAASTTPAPLFGYDRDHYRWLRGSVDYDQDDETWFIIYNLAPDENDAYQGGLTIAADEAMLSDLKNGDYVLMQGRIDEKQVDHRNAPVFRVEQVQVVKR